MGIQVAYLSYESGPVLVGPPTKHLLHSKAWRGKRTLEAAGLWTLADLQAAEPYYYVQAKTTNGNKGNAWRCGVRMILTNIMSSSRHLSSQKIF